MFFSLIVKLFRGLPCGTFIKKRHYKVEDITANIALTTSSLPLQKLAAYSVLTVFWKWIRPPPQQGAEPSTVLPPCSAPDESEKVVKVVSVSVVPVCGCGWVVWRCRHTAPRLLRTARRCASLRQGAPGAALWCACRRGAGEPTPAAARERESKEVKVITVLLSH